METFSIFDSKIFSIPYLLNSLSPFLYKFRSLVKKKPHLGRRAVARRPVERFLERKLSLIDRELES